MKIMITVILSFLTMCAIIFVVTIVSLNGSSFALKNKTSCDLKDAVIVAGEKIIWSGTISRGEEIRVWFFPAREGAFDIIGTCDGMELRKEKIGYIRMWQGFDHRIILADDEMSYKIGRTWLSDKVFGD